MKIFRALALALLLSSAIYANIWHVPDSVATIQAAIDTAESGDTVMVKNPFQNDGRVEITNKQIALLSKSYINNPATYNIASGAAIYSSDITQPLIKLNNASGSEIRGFMLDKDGANNGGGVLIEGSSNIVIDGVHFLGNSLVLDNSSLFMTNAEFYGSDTASYALFSVINSDVELYNTKWRDSEVASLLITGAGSEFRAENLAVYNNICSDDMYKIGSSAADFDFVTSYGNTVSGTAWVLSSTWLNIRNSILEYAPPVDIAQCEITYSSVPGDYPGTGNISIDPLVDATGTYPVLLDISPCISAADPDTVGILRFDILGSARPAPEWAPPDMGAFESERHMPLNEDSRLWISLGGNDVWGNGTENHPFASIQTAVDYARNSDTLILLPGTYKTKALVDGKSLTLASEYIFASNSLYRDSVWLLPDTGSVDPIILVRDVDSLKIAGLNMINGRGREVYNNYSFGGAIYCENSGLDLTCLRFSDNQSEYSGGAIYAINSDINIYNVGFFNNLSYLGGAISLSSSTAYMEGAFFLNNIASSGGAIYIENNSKMIGYYSIFESNRANTSMLEGALMKPSVISQYGGAIYGFSSRLRFHNTIFEDNWAVNQGAAIALRYGALQMVQSTTANNDVDEDSAAVIYLSDPVEDVIILNSILYEPDEHELMLENTDLVVDHSCIYGGTADMILKGDGNTVQPQSMIGDDPGLDEDNHLLDDSPCLNAGIASYALDEYYLINYDSADYDGTAPDMGHLGASPDVHFELLEIQSSVADMPDGFQLLGSYPNPFNPITTIRFTLQNSGHTRLSIYNISGKHVADLVDKNMQSGTYKLRFNADALPSGIYIARLIQNEQILGSHKLLMVK